MRSRHFSVQRIPRYFRLSNYTMNFKSAAAKETNVGDKQQQELLKYKLTIPVHLRLPETFQSHVTKIVSNDSVAGGGAGGNSSSGTSEAGAAAANDGGLFDDSKLDPDENPLIIYGLHIRLERFNVCHRINSLFPPNCSANFELVHDVALERRIERCNRETNVTGSGTGESETHRNSDSSSINSEGVDTCDAKLLQIRANETVFAGLLEFEANPSEIFSAVYFFVVETSSGYFVTRIEVSFLVMRAPASNQL